jgi:hypothetical protein
VKTKGGGRESFVLGGEHHCVRRFLVFDPTARASGGISLKLEMCDEGDDL